MFKFVINQAHFKTTFPTVTKRLNTKNFHYQKQPRQKQHPLQRHFKESRHLKWKQPVSVLHNFYVTQVQLRKHEMKKNCKLSIILTSDVVSLKCFRDKKGESFLVATVAITTTNLQANYEIYYSYVRQKLSRKGTKLNFKLKFFSAFFTKLLIFNISFSYCCYH